MRMTKLFCGIAAVTLLLGQTLVSPLLADPGIDGADGLYVPDTEADWRFDTATGGGGDFYGPSSTSYERGTPNRPVENDTAVAKVVEKKEKTADAKNDGGPAAIIAENPGLAAAVALSGLLALVLAVIAVLRVRSARSRRTNSAPAVVAMMNLAQSSSQRSARPIASTPADSRPRKAA